MILKQAHQDWMDALVLWPKDHVFMTVAAIVYQGPKKIKHFFLTLGGILSLSMEEHPFGWLNSRYYIEIKGCKHKK